MNSVFYARLTQKIEENIFVMTAAPFLCLSFVLFLDFDWNINERIFILYCNKMNYKKSKIEEVYLSKNSKIINRLHDRNSFQRC